MEQENQWIKSIKAKGDKGAANCLVSHYYREIYAFVYRQTADKELAMDLTQEIFISALRTIGGYDEKKGGFRTWLYRVAANKTVDYFRSRTCKAAAQTVLAVDDLLYLSDARDIEKSFERHEDAMRALTQIEALDAAAQRVLRLKIFSGFTFAEIARVLDVPEPTVKTRYYSSIRLLRKRLEGEVLV